MSIAWYMKLHKGNEKGGANVLNHKGTRRESSAFLPAAFKT
jgi:hypothetical protein